MEELTQERRGAPVILGLDTHSEVHVAMALDRAGKRLGGISVPNTRAGYAHLRDWALGLGVVVAAGVEGTGSYGAGFSRFLRAEGMRVLEVNRTSRQHRRRHGKHDAGDAEPVARQVLSGTTSGKPKGADRTAEYRPSAPASMRAGGRPSRTVCGPSHSASARPSVREGSATVCALCALESSSSGV